ncbi:MAG: hypothetical protein J0M08_00460 [Bacteroidetes bacterium]|nr:hypothetical protein [Bacteroidota bacterium]
MSVVSPLFNLIHKLSVYERNEIKKSIEPKSHLLLLFNYLVKAKNYDEKLLMKDNPFVFNNGYLRKLKSALNKHILDTLVITNSSQQAIHELTLEYMRASVLVEKGLFADANKILNEVVEQCKTHGAYQLNIMCYELQLITELANSPTIESLKDKAKIMSSRIAYCSSQTGLLFDLNFFRIHKYKQIVDIKNYEEWIEEILAKQKDVKGEREKQACYFLLGTLYFDIGNIKKALSAIMHAKKLAYHHVQVTHSSIDLYYYTLIISKQLRLLSKYNLFGKQWQKSMEELSVLNKDLITKKIHTFYVEQTQEIIDINNSLFYYKTGRLDELIYFIEKKFVKRTYNLTVRNYYDLFKYACIAHMIKGNYNKAYYWVNKLTELNSQLHMNMSINTNLLHLAILNESAMYNLELEVKNADYFIKKNKISNWQLVDFVEILKASIKQKSDEQIKKMWIDFESRLLNKGDKKSQSFVSDDWLPFYVRSKITEQTFLEIYTQAASSNRIN